MQKMQRNKVVIFIIGESYGSHSVHTFNQTKHSLPLEILLCVWPSGVGFGTNFLQDPPSDMADIFFKGVGTNVNNGYYCFNHYEPENFGQHLCVACLLLQLFLSFSLIVFIWVISKRDILHAFSI
jgi:hypothetical protein